MKKWLIIHKKAFQCAALAAGSTAFVALLGSIFTNTNSTWYQNLEKPSIQPPGFVFPIAWTIIYLLLAAALFVSCQTGALHSDKKLRFWFIASGVLQILWSLFFFTLHMPLFAFFILLACLVVGMLLYFSLDTVNGWVKYLVLPYLLWLFFAGVLNYLIVMLT